MSRLLFGLCVLIIFRCCSGDVFRLNSSNWKKVLDGDWMVEFYAPWCPACRQFGPIWEQLSNTEGLNVKIAAIDVTESPVLSFLFFVNRLPTIFHVKNGVYRQYDGARTLEDLKTYVFQDGYKTITPVPWYLSPSSKHMQFFCHFMDLGLAITQTHQSLIDSGYSFYVSLIIIALGTVFVGLVLGVCLVIFCDCFCPPRPQILRIFRIGSQKPKREKYRETDQDVSEQSVPKQTVDAAGEHEDETEIRHRTSERDDAN
ncbi:Thioredoxin domain containing [Fasciola gigantica]|uniref:Thioredoxin domain containing n=1 Tax=Fasciola gigantica TaxID=46835 RepID=A0A504YYG7_FASGI|nr:Thioredoxin domain containing [Fasciola gigantica]